MTKEEILKEKLGRYLLNISDISHGTEVVQVCLERAMDEYAKQEAITFKEYQDSDLEERKWENYDGHDTWINPHTREVISTEQLYNKFLQSK